MKSSFKRAAQAAAQAGFCVFPIRPGLKVPVITGWQTKATEDKNAVET